jgi:23S rRNA pseudoU1915 N3-methylase RlmH
MNNDDFSILTDEFDDGPVPEVLPRGNVDTSMTLADGTVLRVKTNGETVRLTIAGPDGMTTATMTAADADLLDELLVAGKRDAERARRGL